jgi:hypothetical protein
MFLVLRGIIGGIVNPRRGAWEAPDSHEAREAHEDRKGGETVREDTWKVKGFQPEIIDGDTYPATVTALKRRPSNFGEDYVLWVFHPDGFSENAEPAGSTSMAAGRNSKGMEWARRILGKSSATDMKWGKDLQEKRPVIDWGPDVLVGKRCRIVVEKVYDEDEERYRNRVVNVLPLEEAPAGEGSEEPEADFSDIPF